MITWENYLQRLLNELDYKLINLISVSFTHVVKHVQEKTCTHLSLSPEAATALCGLNYFIVQFQLPAFSVLCTVNLLFLPGLLDLVQMLLRVHFSTFDIIYCLPAIGDENVAPLAPAMQASPSLIILISQVFSKICIYTFPVVFLAEV